eukprot:TRINITY_DN19169_c0_g1_i1.p1 TRINITY_DN19169_c0_g1~~TRINITY_DN19169_c0_g1_i1.p1  ORF type:complete len:303 (-),score=43.18 TRINITY_DN19169_c0_g1_i1:34-942(-)
MKSTLIIEVRDWSIKEFVLRGLAESRLGCHVAFEGKNLNPTSISSMHNSKEIASAESTGITRTTHKEVVLRGEGVIVVKNLSLNMKESDCASFVKGFKIEKEGKNMKLMNCNKNNIRCYYSRNYGKAIIVVDCGGSFPENAAIHLRIDSNSSIVSEQYIGARRLQTNCLSVVNATAARKPDSRCSDFLETFTAVLACSMPAGSLVKLGWKDGAAGDGLKFEVIATPPSGFILRESLDNSLILETTQVYSSSIEIPNIHIKRWLSFETIKFTLAYSNGAELSLIHICRCRRYAVCRSRWSPYH